MSRAEFARRLSRPGFMPGALSSNFAMNCGISYVTMVRARVHR